MKLSEAIRLGAMLLPQCFHYFEIDDDGRPHACCALGGAALAAGYKRARYTIVMTFLNEQWGALLNAEALHPVTGDSSHVDSIIHDLNDPEDVHHWTRERIAAWVATIEPQEVQEEVTSVEPIAIQELASDPCRV